MKINHILKYIPLLAPLPEGYSVGLAIHRELGWNIYIVWIAAAVVALTGFWGVQIFNRMSEYNALLFGDEKKLKLMAPTWKAGLVLLIWFSGVVMITVFLETSPALKAWTPVALVVIGGSAAYLYSLSNVQQAREEAMGKHRVTKDKEREDARNEAKDARKIRQQNTQALATIQQKINASAQGAAGKTRTKSGSKLSDAALLFEWSKNPYLTDTEMVVVFGKPASQGGHDIEVSRQAVAQRRLKMIEKGLIVQNNDGRIVQYLEVVAAAVSGGWEG